MGRDTLIPKAPKLVPLDMVIMGCRLYVAVQEEFHDQERERVACVQGALLMMMEEERKRWM